MSKILCFLLFFLPIWVQAQPCVAIEVGSDGVEYKIADRGELLTSVLGFSPSHSGTLRVNLPLFPLPTVFNHWLVRLAKQPFVCKFALLP